MIRTTRAAGVRAGLAIALSLVTTMTACSAREVRVSEHQPPTATATATPTATPTPTATEAAAVDSTTPTTRKNVGARSADAYAFPDLPLILIPDVTSFTEDSQQYAEKLGDVAAPGSGVQVSGARCDTKGRVINNSSMTLDDNGDGSGSYDDAYKAVVNDGKGAGTYDDAYKFIKVNGDGSGTYDDAYRRIEINTDGSGYYDDAYVRINVNSDGSGDLDDAYKAIKVNADGSGTYSDTYVDITVEADGSGSYEDVYRTVTSNGDGTGTIDGQPAEVDPFPLFRPVGKFPPVKSLRPLGRSCGTLIRLDDQVLFDFDQDTLRTEAGPVLDKVAATLSGLQVTLQVNGHTDAKGEDSYNLDLSRRRAQAVADALAGREVGADLTVQGFGETRPIAPNEINGKDNPSGRGQNRRVEIVVPNG